MLINNKLHYSNCFWTTRDSEKEIYSIHRIALLVTKVPREFNLFVLCCVLLLCCIEREPLFLSLIYKPSYVHYNTVMFHLATLLLCPLLRMRRMARETGDFGRDLVSLLVSYSYSLVCFAVFQHSNKGTRERDVILHCPNRQEYQKLLCSNVLHRQLARSKLHDPFLLSFMLYSHLLGFKSGRHSRSFSTRILFSSPIKITSSAHRILNDIIIH
jgi:hypothetical protein